MQEKFEEIEKLVRDVRWKRISLADFFERLAEICDEIEGLKTIKV